MIYYDLKFYNEFYEDIKINNWSNKQLLHHYKTCGKKEGRFISENEFYTLYPHFDVEFYRDIHSDLTFLESNKYKLMRHYDKYGVKEGRKCSQHYDLHFYNEFYEDIKINNWSNKQLLDHYNTCGKKEGRFISENEFYTLYPYFDVNFYQNLFSDLNIYQGDKVKIMRHYDKYGKWERRKVSQNHDPNFYNEFYFDVKEENTDNQLLDYYKTFDKKERRVISEKEFYTLYPDFDVNFYEKFYPDLNIYQRNKYKLMRHYDKYGKWEERNVNDCGIQNKHYKYPFLFGKYLLGLTDGNMDMRYEIVNENTCYTFKVNKNFAHLHCLDIDKFDYFYNSYIDEISTYCSIVVTYAYGDHSNISHNNFTIIKIKNKGMDIGGKMVCVNYLKDRNIHYENILFLHSKTDNYFRGILFNPLVNNLKNMCNIVETNKKIGGFFPPWIFNGDNNDIILGDHSNKNLKMKGDSKNEKYLNEITEFLGLDKDIKLFPAGNCYFLHKDVIELLFTNKEIYHILNDTTSFDFYWILNFYKNEFHGNETIYEIYHKSIEKNLVCNNLALKNTQLADCMIEHVFERIIINTIKKLGFTIDILSISSDSLLITKTITEVINSYLSNVINQEYSIHTLIKNINISFGECNPLINVKKPLMNVSSYKKNNKKNIFHIVHNFGGGTDTYISNMVNIYDQYNHIIIKIVGLLHVKVNNVLFDISMLSFLLDGTNSVVFIHNLLFDYGGTMINKNVLDILLNNKTIYKILIIHDYYLLLPNIPNPIKSKNELPTVENINFATHIINSSNKVIFNSHNCYLNYGKYIYPIQNSMILNNAPDIDYYHHRCFPPIKNTYNIGMIGHVALQEHKGKYLLEKILSSYRNNSKYRFITFGDSNIGHLYPNLVSCGSYNNENILKLIKNTNIDYFLFLSVFEETYSFTLSIALKTGLPIIYNNIGSYTERLSSYHNCFPFTEDNYMEVHTIINNMENNYITNNNVKPVINDEELVLYKNIPELSDYLKVDDHYNFDVSVIQQNLFHKNVCFIAFANISNSDPTYKNILMDQINYIKNSGLYDKLDYIFITMLGEYTTIISDYKIKVIYYSPDIYEWEFPNYKRIKYFCDTILFNVNILEIHIKGAQKKPHSHEWRKYLEYFLIEKHDLCLQILQQYKCVGVNEQFYFDEVSKYKNHFSGNFWWSRSDHIKTLPLVETNEDRYAVEHWLIGNMYKNDYRHYLSLHHTDYDLYQRSILPEEYRFDIIKNRILTKIQEPFINTRPIYGVYFICCMGNYLNILKNQVQKLIESGLYHQSDLILCFVCNQTNECLSFLQNYNKMQIISTSENLYEKFAINNYKNYLPNSSYHLYYMHTKGISQTGKCFDNWRNFCDYFTIYKWRLSIELLTYYDCVGTNLKNFPKKHYSGNFWWSKSEHLKKLKNIQSGYLSCEMYLLSYLKTNYVSIYQTFVTHGDTEYPEELYRNKSDNELLNHHLSILPIFNDGDKKCITMCDPIDTTCEPPILELS